GTQCLSDVYRSFSSAERFPAFYFFFQRTPTPLFSTLSLHDALPISAVPAHHATGRSAPAANGFPAAYRHGNQCRNSDRAAPVRLDRKSTRLNSSHVKISYAVFCLKKKRINIKSTACQVGRP